MIWLARKVSTRRGAIGTSTPVFGLRPIRSPLSRRMKLPKPEIFHILPFGQRRTHVVENALDDRSGFGARQADLVVNDVGEVRPRQRARLGLSHHAGVRHLIPDPRSLVSATG
jgi:hypothetical protein